MEIITIAIISPVLALIVQLIAVAKFRIDILRDREKKQLEHDERVRQTAERDMEFKTMVKSLNSAHDKIRSIQTGYNSEKQNQVAIFTEIEAKLDNLAGTMKRIEEEIKDIKAREIQRLSV